MSPKANADIAGRAVRGSFYSVGAASVTITLGFARAVLLARLLSPEHFGVVTLALFFINLTGQLRALGLDTALIHHPRADERTLATYFTLRLGSLALTLSLLLLALPLLLRFYPTMPLLSGVLLAFIVVEVARAVSIAQETILTRAMAFRRLAIADVLAAMAMTVVAPLLAWQGWGVWSLVAELATGVLTRTAYIWAVYPDWRPRFGWDQGIARWFWDYGRPTWAAVNLTFLLDRFDDFWVGTALGQTPLGYYSRAYEFARYPRRVVANPVVGVFLPTFARLQDDRLRLSQAFYRSASAIVRVGFWVAGGFALIMPEFIHLVIGDKWQPMLLTFRLMLVYTLLDSLLALSANLLLAVGRPRDLMRVRLGQALFFVPAVITGAHLAGIEGVALAADAMLLVGTGLVYRRLREIVDFSPLRLGFRPLMALILAWGIGLAAEGLRIEYAAWQLGFLKLALFSALYLGILGLVERHEYRAIAQTLRRLLLPASKGVQE